MKNEELEMIKIQRAVSREHRTAFTALLFAICYLLFFGCANPMNPLNEAERPAAGYGSVRINLAGGEARTVFPSRLFDSVEYTFTKAGGEGETLQPDADGMVVLESGLWTLDIEAFVGEIKAASGSAEFIVASGSTQTVTIILEAEYVEGTGIFAWHIAYPQGAEVDAFTLQSLSGGPAIDLAEDAGETALSGSRSIDAGFYLLTILLSLEAEEEGGQALYAGKNEVVHIYGALTSVFGSAASPIEFTEENFNAIPFNGFLPFDKWVDGELYNSTQSSSAVTFDEYYIIVSPGRRYNIYLNRAGSGNGDGTKTAAAQFDIRNGNGTNLTSWINTAFTEPQSFTTTADDTFTIRVRAVNNNGLGTYAIKYNYTFVQVEGITVQEVVPVGEAVLIASAEPAVASQTIVWTVKDAGDTGAVIDGNVLTTTGGGTVTLTAAIAEGNEDGTDYIEDIEIEICADHEYEWVTTIQPNLYNKGLEEQICSICGHKSGETRDIDALNIDTMPTGLYLGTLETINPETRITTVAANDFNAAITRANSVAGDYVLLISQNVNSTNHTLNTGNVRLTIIGQGQERTVQYNGSANQWLLWLNANGVQLTLGQNITLRGIPNGNTNLVATGVNAAATLTMLDGSKITGHTSDRAAVGLYNANSIFIMEGGEITGNHSSDTLNNATSSGGVYIESYAHNIIIKGGRIAGNTAMRRFNTTPGSTSNQSRPSDIYTQNSILLSGDFEIGVLNTSTAITLDGPFTGSVGTLNYVHTAGHTNSLNELIIRLTAPGVRVVRPYEDYAITQEDINKVNSILGEFLGNSNSSLRQNILPDRYIRLDSALNGGVFANFTAVTGITSDLPAAVFTGYPITLTGTVTPATASFSDIVWSVKDAGTTGAVINNNALTATDAGTVTVTASVLYGRGNSDFTADFEIEIIDRTAFLQMLNALASAPANTADDPIDLPPLKTELTAHNLTAFFIALREEGKYVNLDLSGSTGMETFHPGTANTGERYIVSLVLPDITTIIQARTGDVNTFQFFTALKSVSGNAVDQIGSSAFQGCTSLTEVSFPAATSIGNYAFYGCTSLTSLTEVSFPLVTTIGTEAFNGCTSLTEVSFPLVTTISLSVFWNCTSLTEVSFPIATTIDPGAFRNCTSLTEVSFPLVTTIGNTAFWDCTSLTEISFSATTRIDEDAFRNCTSLARITLGTITSANFNNTAFPQSAFPQSGNFRTVYFASGGGAGTYVTGNPGNNAVWTKE